MRFKNGKRYPWDVEKTELGAPLDFPRSQQFYAVKYRFLENSTISCNAVLAIKKFGIAGWQRREGEKKLSRL